MALSAEDKRLLLKLARDTLGSYADGGCVPAYAVMSPSLLQPRATFVTLRWRDTGELRGCRGERAAHRPLVESVIYTTIASAVDDPRFAPVTPAEVPRLRIEISVLTTPRLAGPESVVVGQHGVIIARGHRCGLLLPQVALTHGWTRETLLRETCEKAGLPPDAWRSRSARIEIFEAEVWEEAR